LASAQTSANKPTASNEANFSRIFEALFQATETFFLCGRNLPQKPSSCSSYRFIYANFEQVMAEVNDSRQKRALFRFQLFRLGRMESLKRLKLWE